jgi:hypothetical protein
MKKISLVALPLAAAAAAALPAFAATPAPAPQGGFAVGKVTAANGSRFVVQGQSSVTGVIVTKSTTVSETSSADAKALVAGACVSAVGTRNKQGQIAATSVTVSKGTGAGCTAGGPPGNGPRRVGADGARPPQNRNGNAPSRQRPANFAAAFGSVASLKGTLLTVKGRGGSTKVVLSGSTRIGKRSTASASAIAVGKCAAVRGKASANGSVVTAQNVDLSAAGKNGCDFGVRFGPGPNA